MTFEHYDYENKIPLDKLYDELDLIYKKVDAAYYKKTNTSDEFLEKVDKIQRLYGYMAYGLKSIICREGGT